MVLSLANEKQNLISCLKLRCILSTDGFSVVKKIIIGNLAICGLFIGLPELT